MTEAVRKNALNLANNLTILRVVLVPAFVTCLVYVSPERPWLHALATAIFLVACATDALDGWLARRLNQQSVFGSFLDPIADKFLLLSAFLCLTFMQNLPLAMRIPVWVTICVVARDVVILIGAVVIFVTTGKLEAHPLRTSKATTFFQMLTVVSALVSEPEVFQRTLHWVTAALTAVSGVLYIRVGKRLIP